MSQHSILPPSRAARRMACPGSRVLEELFPREDSESSIEGTQAHELAAALLRYKLDLGDFPNTDNYPDEMFEAAKTYLKQISVYIEVCRNDNLHIEEKIAIDNIYPGCFGTPDAWCLTDTGVLHIWDFKYGHSFVDVFENWQLIAYAAGIIHHTEKYRKNAVKQVHFHIVQPRCYQINNVDSHGWQISYEKLERYFMRLVESEIKSMQPNAPCQPSPQCKHCSASHVCSALQRTALDITEIATENSPNEMAPVHVGSELRLLQRAAVLLDARINGLEQQATTLLKAGKEVSHFALEQTQGRETWKIPADKVKELGMIYGAAVAKTVDVLTPRQAAKAGIPEKVVKRFSERTSGGLKLVPDDGTKARKIFGTEK